MKIVLRMFPRSQVQCEEHDYLKITYTVKLDFGLTVTKPDYINNYPDASPKKHQTFQLESVKVK